MIRQIMKNEWTLLSREKILYLALPIYLVMLIYGIMNGTEWKTFLYDNSIEAREMADKVFQSKRDTLDKILAGKLKYSYAEDPRLPAQLARYKGYEMATKPPAPTAAISIGQSDVVPSYVKVQWKPMFKQANTDEIENPRNLAVGTFDLSFVLIYLYPLLIIALSYNVLSSEREQGTQVLLLSQPVSVRQFVLGKILLRGSLIIGTAVVVSLFGLIVANPDILSAGYAWRIAMMAVILALYGTFWFGLAVLVNALGKKSSTNALIMMAAWIGLVLVLPAALNLAAKTLYPLPSRIAMVQALRKGDEQATKESKFSRAYRADLLRAGEEAALKASNTDFYLKVLPLEQQAEKIAQPIFDEFENQRQAQQTLAERLKYLSPAAVTQIAFNELADSSAGSFNNFNQQVEAYHDVWRQYFLKPVQENRVLTKDELWNIPRFQYQPESGSTIFGRIFGDVLALLIFAGAMLVIGFRLLRNYSGAAR
ncbi:hypothetical protein GCM10011349_44340 [Novosphingobium indicum]|uniref:ABC transporter permease n=1 Tax=Novosphingobium indicum TaxID=462949 RepID=A0ABQ2JYX1_9SPHN|nr:ABC transporter permease subunit [Novosphingobium indicum]GGN61566.1 hypothetical protein GCM10011349_44340 [Novosphingobium indicum]